MRRVALAGLGAYLCIVSSIVHRHVIEVGAVLVPWGTALAVAVTYVVVIAAARVAPVGGAWLGMGWGVALTAQQLSPGGSYLVASDWIGYSFIVGSLGAIVLGVLRPNSLVP
ncbi:hypothetical protein [Aeromicrobium sp.]|uniref:hypothetical protein n=1 Tax=Aeromicrobium sp. TaxID=1871063 RepID=UPI0019930C01|nr:hypothetical protein [Aeromicrobium sp.]MBC7632875.1 hypothetical protein [Aeromicrobium sp.]